MAFPFAKYSDFFWTIENWDIPEQLRAQTLWFCSLLDKVAGDGGKD